jgi:hypothetical protein
VKKKKHTFAKTTRFVLHQITPVADSRAADSPEARLPELVENSLRENSSRVR